MGEWEPEAQAFIYFEGLTPYEDVTIVYAGIEWMLTEANQDGGAWTQVPTPYLLAATEIAITATGSQSGVSVSKTFAPIPTPSP